MSNHFNELREDFDKNKRIFSDDLSDNEISSVFRIFADVSEDAVCFYAGETPQIQEFNLIEELVVLPYRVVWIESKPPRDGYRLGHLLWEDDGLIHGQVFMSRVGQWWYAFSFVHRVVGGTRVSSVPPGLSVNEVGALIGIAFRFLSALNCTNINRVEHKPPEKLQKARAKRGKQPLFSYWTLEIDLPKSRAAGENYGGTHAAPRLHLRRGHPRQYAAGKYCWVQPCVVGNKASGMVHKDYAANYAHP